MGSKFFVYAGKRWRELDTKDGHLEGWGRARFVYFKQGRLNMARRGAVLRALRALGTGCGVAGKDGLPLSRYEPEPPSIKAHQTLPTCCTCRPRHELMADYCTRCANDARFDRLLKATTSHVAVQCAPTANAATQVSIPAQENQQILSQAQHEKPNEAMERINPVTAEDKKKKETSQGRSKKRKGKRSPSSEDARNKNADGDGDHLKELIIEESDVEVLRRFLSTEKGAAFRVNVEQFDADDAYKEKVFYAINPLVSVERCPRIDQIIRSRRNAGRSSSEDSLSLKQFMTVLGLRTVADEPAVKRYKTRGSIRNHDKENEAHGKYEVLRSPTESKKILKEDNIRSNKESKKKGRREESNVVEISSGEEFAPKAPVREARSKANGGRRSKVGMKKGHWREYSREEDAAILDWVSEGARARRVNGNEIWKEMQRDHHEATGIARSWHSLRNRYLRHLLASLPRLADPARAQRLRADARAGELKSRKGHKDNSLLAMPPVRSAWARRPRAPPAPSPAPSEDGSSDGTPSVSLPSQQKAVQVRRTPRFSDVLRRFAERPQPPWEAAGKRRRLYNPRS